MKLKSFALTAATLACPLIIASAQSPDPAKMTNAINPEAMRLLRQVIAEQQKNPDRIIRIPATTNTANAHPTKVELEKQYLSGQLSAKQYQKALDRLAKEEKKRFDDAEKQHKREAQEAAAKVATKSTAPVAPATTPLAPVTPGAAAVEPTAEQRKLTDVEQRIDAMMKQKAEREKAAAAATRSTNSVANPVQTKRQRLDALLKQVIEGKLSDSDYKAQRSKILAEPD